MFEATKKYSEEHYIDKEQLKRELDPYLVDPVWEEIQKYRRIFRVEYVFLEGKGYITWNRLTSFQLLKSMQIIEQWEPYSDTCEEVGDDKLFALLHSYHPFQEPYAWFIHTVSALQLPLSKPLQEFLIQPDQPLLLKLFLLSIYAHSYQNETIRILLKLTAHERLLPVIMEVSLNSNREHLPDDLTPLFLTFLNDIWLKISDLMVLLNSSCNQEDRLAMHRVLQERYPSCSREQINFYVEHRTLHHYYTIAHYMEYCHVCYETARTALDQLVQQNWYQKQKLGKKFVYYVE